jgi:hypothetical protein
MKFGTFFTWFKKQTHSILPKSHLDHKLIGSINTKTVPSLTQLKYVGHFLAPQEKKILAGLGGIALVAALALGGIFVGTHFTAVAKDGGDYSEAMVGQPKFVNPIYASVSDIDSDLSFLTYTGLFHYTNGQTLTPDLAEKYTLSDDKKIYTVTLKKNISWSDNLLQSIAL